MAATAGVLLVRQGNDLFRLDSQFDFRSFKSCDSKCSIVVPTIDPTSKDQRTSKSRVVRSAQRF